MKPKTKPPPDENLIKITAPYIKGTTERVTRLLKDFNVKIFNRNQNSLRKQLCNLKDKKSNMDKKNVIYQVKCQDCPANYIGESSRTAKIRIHEHTNDIQQKRIKNHIFTHERDEHHKFNMTNVNVLMQETQLRPRKFIEGAFSHFNDYSVNRAQEMPTAYLNILQSAIQ